MTDINIPNNSSNFLSPYLSRRRNVKVSITVISTPTQRGILEWKEQNINLSLSFFALSRPSEVSVCRQSLNQLVISLRLAIFVHRDPLFCFWQPSKLGHNTFCTGYSFLFVS